MSNEQSDNPDISYESIVKGAVAEEQLSDKVESLAEVLSDHLLEDQKAIINKQTQITGFDESASTGSKIQDIEDVFDQDPEYARQLFRQLKEFYEEQRRQPPGIDELREAQGELGAIPDGEKPVVHKANSAKIKPTEQCDGDYEHAINIEPGTVDLIVTSPPYWQKRDYGIEDQLGQEPSPEEYVENLVNALDMWRPFLRSTASVFLNIGDTYNQLSTTGIPGMFVQAARKDGWTIRNEIIWSKPNGIPSSASDRLAARHEQIFHLVDSREYYYDLFGYSKVYGNGSNGGDVWEISHEMNKNGHLAPFPSDLVRRAVTLACPPSVCTECGHVSTRELERDPENLDTSRQQAQRALEIYHENDNLTKEHLYAIQKVGISDAGKAKEFQEGAGENADDVQELAGEAKEILGGYFREFTFPKPTTKSWTECDCDAPKFAGKVMDPFAGSGTTLEAAAGLGYRSVGVDLTDEYFDD